MSTVGMLGDVAFVINKWADEERSSEHAAKVLTSALVVLAMRTSEPIAAMRQAFDNGLATVQTALLLGQDADDVARALLDAFKRIDREGAL